MEGIREVSDCLVVNQNGELSCFYVNEEYPRRITGYIRLQPSVALISLDTRDYQIDGYGRQLWWCWTATEGRLRTFDFIVSHSLSYLIIPAYRFLLKFVLLCNYY